LWYAPSGKPQFFVFWKFFEQEFLKIGVLLKDSQEFEP
jgi:hypothetical protein